MKLEAEQARYRNFLENIDEFCVESDLAGKLTFFNDAFCRVLESSAEEIKNSTYDKYYSENMAKELYQLYNNVYKTGQPARTYDFKMTFRDGRILYLDMTVSLVRDSDGNPIGFRAVSRDVTERVKAEENLKRYKEFVENVEDACFETDLRGRFTFANHAVSRQSGYSREEFLSLPPEGLYVSKEARNRVRPVFREVLETGIPKKVVYQLQRKNGEIYSVENVISLMRDNKGNPVGYRGITRDVTERIKNEQALERYRDFLDSIDELCWENDLNGKLIFANQKALHVFGFDDKEELQRYGSTQEERLKAKVSYQTYLSPGNRERFYKMYLDVYESGESKVFYNTQVLRQGGGRDY
ncbi:MAG: PAS domain S-box protein, partial [Deltaproteobacteria bacterium]|nr:PAS domain S-box protein [Deltaproteobacteria bacterium]